MKPSAPSLAPLLRSNTQGAILGALFLDPVAEHSLAELERSAHVSLPTVSREVDRLVGAGFATDRRVGRTRLVRANTEHPYFRPLQEILTRAYGPPAVLGPLLAEVQGVERAYIYGSWAARFAGSSGADPHDIDVLAVGNRIDIDALYAACDRAQDALGREVNARAITPDEWSDPSEAFVSTVRSRPLVELEIGAQS